MEGWTILHRVGQMEDELECNGGDSLVFWNGTTVWAEVVRAEDVGPLRAQ
jgi:hypothetical protein